MLGIIVRFFIDIVFYAITMPFRIVAMLWKTAEAVYYGIKYGSDWWRNYWKEFAETGRAILRAEAAFIKYGWAVGRNYYEEAGLD